MELSVFALCKRVKMSAGRFCLTTVIKKQKKKEKKNVLRAVWPLPNCPCAASQMSPRFICSTLQGTGKFLLFFRFFPYVLFCIEAKQQEATSSGLLAWSARHPGARSRRPLLRSDALFGIESSLYPVSSLRRLIIVGRAASQHTRRQRSHSHPSAAATKRSLNRRTSSGPWPHSHARADELQPSF